MSVQDVRATIQRLSAAYPKDFLVIRSPHQVERIDIANAQILGPFDNASSQIISALQDALSAGKQAAIQAAGSDQLLVFTPKRGSQLLR